jgi:hypothetical protein
MMDRGVDHTKQSRSRQQHAVELIAHESHVPIDDVAQLYGSELAKLEADAHIKSFLPIFALRNVRDKLRQRSGADQSGV